MNQDIIKSIKMYNRYMFGGGAMFSFFGASAVCFSFLLDKINLTVFVGFLIISFLPFYLFAVIAIRFKRYEYVNQEIIQYSYRGNIKSFPLSCLYGYSFSTKEPNHVQIHLTKTKKFLVPISDSLILDLKNHVAML